MRRESQSDKKSSRSSPHESNSSIPSPRMNQGDRSELAHTETRDQRLPHPSRWTKSSGRGGKASGSTKRHPETFQRHPALLKEGRDTKENPGRQDFRRSQRKDIGAVEANLANKVSVNKSSKSFHYAEGQSKNGVLRKLKHIFLNNYQRIKSICSPAKGGTGCYRFNYQPGS